MIIDFVVTDEESQRGIAIEEYGGKLSLTKGYIGRDGENHFEWCYPQRNRAPQEKAIPWKIQLGDKQEAIEVLNRILSILLDGKVQDKGDITDNIPF